MSLVYANNIQLNAFNVSAQISVAIFRLIIVDR
jgi:hypothetical protein